MTVFQCDEGCKWYKPCIDLISSGRPRCGLAHSHIIPQGFQEFSQYVGCAAKNENEIDFLFHRQRCSGGCRRRTELQKCYQANRRGIPEAFIVFSGNVGCHSFANLANPSNGDWREL